MKHILRYLCFGLLLSSTAKVESASEILATDAKACSTSCCSTSSECCSSSTNCCQPVRTCIIPISAGSCLPFQYHESFDIDKNDECSFEADLSLTYRFEQSTNSCQMAQMLFGCNPISLKGSVIAAEGAAGANVDPSGSWMAEYFALGPNTNATVCLSPRIRNNILDFKFDIGGEKAWFQINVPIVRTNWQINGGCCAPTASGTLDTEYVQSPTDLFQINVANAKTLSIGKVAGTTALTLKTFNEGWAKYATGGSGFQLAKSVTDGQPNVGFQGFGEWGEEGYVGDSATVITAESSWTDVLNSTQPTTVPGPGVVLSKIPAADLTYGAIAEMGINAQKNIAGAFQLPAFGNVAAGKYNQFNFSSCNTSKWGVADLQLELGYDFINRERGHFGLYIKGVIPTGGSTNCCWAQYVFAPIVGNGGHGELGLGATGHGELWKCGDSNFTINLDGYITHMFNRQQFRTFDTLPADRYAVVKELTYDLGSGDQTKEGANCDASDFIFKNKMYRWGDLTAQCITTSVNVRGEAMIDLTYSACNWELGIGYGFSGQSQEISSCCDSCPSTTGSLYYGYKSGASTNGIGSLYGPQADTVTLKLNDGEADYDAANSNFGFFYTATGAWVTIDGKGGISWAQDTENRSEDGDQAENSTVMGDVFQPSNINTCSGLMGGQILNRLFAHIDYVWDDCCWAPELGVLGSYGFTTNANPTPAFWDLGARLGFSF